MSDAVIGLAITFMFGWIAWTIFSSIRRYKIARLQAEVQNKLLDKFGSSPELLAYVQTEAGKRLLDSLAVEQQRTWSPHMRIIGALQAGVILIALGLGLEFMTRVDEGGHGFFISGGLTLALGIGFSLAGAVSYYLSKSFGLFDKPSTRQG
jgi:hypothetical protein